MERDRAYEIVISEFLKTIYANPNNEELTEDLWHCVAQLEKIKTLFNK